MAPLIFLLLSQWQGGRRRPVRSACPALGRWLAEGLLNPQMELMGVVWLAILPVVVVAAAGLAMAAEGLRRRRGWARWAAVVVFSLLGVTALAGLVDWIGALVRERARGGWGPAPVDLITAVLFLAISVGVIVLLMTPATRRDFRSARRLAGSSQSL